MKPGGTRRRADLFLREQPVSARGPEAIRQLVCEVIDHGGFTISHLRFPNQKFSNLAHGQPLLRHPLPPRLRGPFARRKRGPLQQVLQHRYSLTPGVIGIDRNR